MAKSLTPKQKDILENGGYIESYWCSGTFLFDGADKRVGTFSEEKAHELTYRGVLKNEHGHYVLAKYEAKAAAL